MSRESDVIESIRRVASQRADRALEFDDLIADLMGRANQNGDEQREQSVLIYTRATLRSLEAVNLIQPGRHPGGQFGRIELSNSFPLEGKDLIDDGGRDQVPPGRGGDGQNRDDSDGSGYRQVLSHPFLFSLPEDEFNALVGQIGI